MYHKTISKQTQNVEGYFKIANKSDIYAFRVVFKIITNAEKGK